MNERKAASGNLALKQKPYEVITIEASAPPKDTKLRVAAYARVSSSSEDQLNSFAAQNNYYTALISGKENWAMVDIYADEGITGTSVEKRDDFKRMIADCRKGKIDRILVKSISRFARNTKECLEVIRELKLMGVSVFFEKENIDTADMSGEMMTAMFASFAQAESQSISGNMRWSYQKRMQSGRFITCKAPFGYRMADGKMEVDDDEAKIVRMIFDMYLRGCSIKNIGERLTDMEVRTRDGNMRWTHKSLAYILQNEKYVGDSLLQKHYASDTLPIYKRKNRGEKTQYYVRNSHPAIIEREVYEEAQRLQKRRESKVSKSRQEHIFSRRIICGECGSYFGRKICRDSVFWVCRTHKANRATVRYGRYRSKS